MPSILMACFLRWIAAVAAAWLEVALERPSPRRIYRWNLLVAGLSFGAIYSGIDLIPGLATRNVDMALFALVVFPVQFPICLLLATVSWALPLASGLVRVSASGTPVPAWVFLDGTHGLEGLPPRPPMRFGTTLKIGAIGAVLSTFATVGALIAFRTSPTLRKWVLSEGAGHLYSIGIWVLAAVIAAITARAVAKRARCLPVFQGLFAAALTSWMAASGMLAVRAWFDNTPITIDTLLGNYTNLVDTGALASAFLLVSVPALGLGFRRVFGFALPRQRAGDPSGEAVVRWPRRIAFRLAVVVISAGAVSALYVQIRRAVEAVEAIDKKNAAAPALASNAAGSAATPGMKAEGSTVLADPHLQMVRIPAGTFEMGSPQEEAGRDKDEGPVHRVTIPEFELGLTPVTRAQFAAFVRETGYAAGGNCRTVYREEWVEETERWWREPGFPQDDSHPVVCVNWLDAQAYVDWLRSKTGQSWRLPSEAEWEYAARAGTTTARFWGNDFDAACDFANVLDESGQGVVSAGLGAVMAKCDDGYAYTAPVGHFRPNGFGLYDMLGNVWQAVQDCGHASYESAPVDGSAWTSGDCDKRVSRGGAWNTRARYVRSASRVRVAPEERAASAGFRVARSLPQGGDAAGHSQAWPWCTREDRQVISPDLQISGCTTVIQSGAETEGNLAIAFANRCGARREQGDFDRAIQDCDEALRRKPDSAWAVNNRGGAYHGKGDNDRAIEDYTQAIRLMPNYAGAFINRGDAYRGKGDNERAIQDYDQAIRLQPVSALAFADRGDAWYGKKEYDRAIADYNEAIRLMPNYAYVFNARCWTRAAANKELEAALGDCNESLRLKPGDANGLDSRGFVYFRMAEYDKSIADYNASLERDPKFASSLYVRGLAKRRNRDQASGDADISAAEAIYPKISEVYAELGVKP